MNSVLDVAASVLQQAEQAWNEADGAAFGALFADESDFVNIRGEHDRGSAVIGRGHQAIFDTTYAGSTVRDRVEHARPLALGHILAVAGATLEAPTGPMRRRQPLAADGGARLQDGRWPITAFTTHWLPRTRVRRVVVAVFGDAHAHAEAFEAVIAAADACGVEQLWSLGDMVGRGRTPSTSWPARASCARWR